jgi:uncharacterized membrane protein YdjX (TVP38/TMEM64 family)
MEKPKKIKIIVSLLYLVVILSFLYFFFTKFSFQELTSYEFIKNNREYFFHLKQSNLFLLSIIFLALAIFWVLMAGFGSPVALLSGFIFGKWLGTIIAVFGLTFGATLFYILGNYFFKDFIKKKFLNKFKKLENKFKKSEFIYLLLYRFIGGIPFVVSNVVPCIFNVKIKNFFYASLLGMMPQIFLIVSIGSGLEKIINQNLEAPKIIDLLYLSEIYVPLTAFVGLVVLTIVARKIFYKN